MSLFWLRSVDCTDVGAGGAAARLAAVQIWRPRAAPWHGIPLSSAAPAFPQNTWQCADSGRRQQKDRPGKPLLPALAPAAQIVRVVQARGRPPLPPRDALPGGPEVFWDSGLSAYINLMEQCWAQRPEDRPDFKTVTARIR